MGSNSVSNLQKCGEILLDINSKNRKTKIYIFHCTFCNIECDQLKKFSLHIGEEHLNSFEDIFNQTDFKFEAEPEEIGTQTFADIEVPDVKIFESSVVDKANVNADPLDTVNSMSTAVKHDVLNCEVKQELNYDSKSTFADEELMDFSASIDDSDKEAKEKFLTSKTSEDTSFVVDSGSDDERKDDLDQVPLKKRKLNIVKKGKKLKRKRISIEMSSDDSKDADSHVEKESNAMKKHKRCKKRWMYSKIKKMPFCGSNSSTENNSCENCKQLSRKIDSLQDSVSNLCKIVQQQNQSIMSSFTEIKVVTTKLVRQETSITAAANYFPVTSDQMLQNLEKQISADNRDIYVSTMSKLWRNCVGKNLENILDRKIVMNYNIDGTHGKLRLKEYKNFYEVLIDSIVSLPSLERKDPEMVLRQAMQLSKKKQFKQQSALKKKPEEVKIEAH